MGINQFEDQELRVPFYVGWDGQIHLFCKYYVYVNGESLWLEVL